jgi:cytochrome c biogenesis protein CcmG/thiol:disulfide interchange protein DsbE
MTNKTKFSLIVVFLLIAAVGYGLFSPGNNSEPVVRSENTQTARQTSAQASDSDEQYPVAPDFSLSDLDGNKVSLSDHRGKVVVLDFWATWCPPCRKGIPDFVEMQNEYGKDNFIVLGINLDRGDDVGSMVEEFAKNYNINYPVLYHNPQIVMAYGGIQSIPTTFVIDQEGKVRQGVVGYRPKEFFKGVIDPLL